MDENAIILISMIISTFAAFKITYQNKDVSLEIVAGEICGDDDFSQFMKILNLVLFWAFIVWFCWMLFF